MSETVVVPGDSNFSQVGPLLQVVQLEKIFGSRDSITRALNGVSFTVGKGEFVGLMGPSGSGKSTLLNCVSTIDKPTSGRIMIDGQDITRMRRGALTKFRRDQLGFIFQDAGLVDTLTGYENIALALTIQHKSAKFIDQRVKEIAAALGVSEVLGKYPHQMSGGQRQRVAAARAIASEPKIIMADEPTGALDSRSASVLLNSLELLNTQMGATIMMVTHDAFAASFADRVMFIKDGKLFNEVRRGNSPQQDFYRRIMEVQAFLGGHAQLSEEEGLKDVR